MIEMTSLFAGILSRSSSTVINIGASIWVMDPAVQTVANTIPLPDYVLDEVRSIPGVKYAVPLYSGAALLKLRDGTYQAANVVGLDDTSLFGRPQAASGQHRGYLRRERLHRHRRRGVLQAQESENRHRVRAQRSSRRHRRNRATSLPAGCSAYRPSTPPTTARCNTSPTRASPFPICWSSPRRRRTWPQSRQRVAAAGYLALTQRRIHRQDLGLLHVPDRHRHQHAADDTDQLHRRAVDLRADLLHVHSREHRQVRCARRRSAPRAASSSP